MGASPHTPLARCARRLYLVSLSSQALCWKFKANTHSNITIPTWYTVIQKSALPIEHLESLDNDRNICKGFFIYLFSYIISNSMCVYTSNPACYHLCQISSLLRRLMSPTSLIYATPCHVLLCEDDLSFMSNPFTMLI